MPGLEAGETEALDVEAGLVEEGVGEGKVERVDVPGVEIVRTDGPVDALADQLVRAGEEEMEARVEAVDVGGGENEMAARGQHASRFVEDGDVRGQVLDHFAEDHDVGGRVFIREGPREIDAGVDAEAVEKSLSAGADLVVVEAVVRAANRAAVALQGGQDLAAAAAQIEDAQARIAGQGTDGGQDGRDDEVLRHSGILRTRWTGEA